MSNTSTSPDGQTGRSWTRHLAEPRLTAGAILVLLGLAAVPFAILGERSWVTIHDTLDSNLVWNLNAARAGAGFIFGNDGVLPNVMNGLSRAWLTGQINLATLWFGILPPFAAYAFNSIVVRLIAFFGCRRLLRRFLGDRPEEEVVVVALALLFSLLPFYTLSGVTAAGLPLLVVSLFDVQAGRARWYDWAVILLFPFFSSLYLIGVFACGVAGLRALYLLWRRPPQGRRLLVATSVLTICYTVSEWPTINAVVFRAAPPTHRIANDPAAFVAEAPLPGMMREFALFLSEGQTHAPTLRVWPIVIALLFAAAAIRRSGAGRRVTALLGAVVAISAFAGFYPLVLEYVSPYVSAFRQFHFDRLYFFLPLIWFILFFLAGTHLIRTRRGAVLFGALVFLQAASILRSSKEISYNVFKLLGSPKYHPTFGEFFDPELFARLRDHIGKDPATYRVVALGMHPTILQYNGFYTLDAYQAIYPLSYKMAFREVIVPELEKSPELKMYYDAWGSRCYLFSSEIGTDFLWRKDSDRQIHNLEIDVAKLVAMGGRYIVSNIPLQRLANMPVKPVATFESPRSYWRLYLYALTPAG